MDVEQGFSKAFPVHVLFKYCRAVLYNIIGSERLGMTMRGEGGVDLVAIQRVL